MGLAASGHNSSRDDHLAMAMASLNEPIYQDKLIAWHNSRIWIAMLVFAGSTIALAAADVVQKFQPPPPQHVLVFNQHGEPVGQILPITTVQAIPNLILKAGLGDFVHDAFSVDQDQDEENRMVAKTQARLTGQAAQAVGDWYERDGGKHDPRTTWRYTWAEAIPLDVLKLDGSDRFQVDYRVVTHADRGITVTTTTCRATMHVIVGRSTNPDSLGWFIDWIDFGEVSK